MCFLETVQKRRGVPIPSVQGSMWYTGTTFSRGLHTREALALTVPHSKHEFCQSFNGVWDCKRFLVLAPRARSHVLHRRRLSCKSYGKKRKDKSGYRNKAHNRSNTIVTRGRHAHGRAEHESQRLRIVEHVCGPNIAVVLQHTQRILPRKAFFFFFFLTLGCFLVAVYPLVRACMPHD